MKHGLRFSLLSALAVAGCATPPKPAEPAAVALVVQTPAPQTQASLLQAQLAGSELLGLFTLDSHYQVQQADRRQDASALGQQSLSQGLQTHLPLPLGTPLQLDFSHRLEQRWSHTGMQSAQRTQTAQARWSDGSMQLSLDARRSTENAVYGCGLDATLRAPLPDSLSAVSGAVPGLKLGGQLCQRNLPGERPQQAQILSAQTGWNDAYGRRRLRISHAMVRERAAGGRSEAASSGIELDAQHRIELDGWSLSQQFALRPADEAGQATGWAARSQLSRRVHQLPVTASWQRSESAIWSLGGAQTPGREARLGIDLSAPLKRWLSSNAGAELSYHRLDPADPSLADDDQVRLGVSLGW